MYESKGSRPYGETGKSACQDSQKNQCKSVPIPYVSTGDTTSDAERYRKECWPGLSPRCLQEYFLLNRGDIFQVHQADVSFQVPTALPSTDNDLQYFMNRAPMCPVVMVVPEQRLLNSGPTSPSPSSPNRVAGWTFSPGKNRRPSLDVAS